MYRALLMVGVAAPLMSGHLQAQSPWYARDRWQLELSTGSVVFECQLRERRGNNLVTGALAGADDEVYQLTLLSLPERRIVVDTLLQRHPPRP